MNGSQVNLFLEISTFVERVNKAEETPLKNIQTSIELIQPLPHFCKIDNSKSLHRSREKGSCTANRGRIYDEIDFQQLLGVKIAINTR